MNTYIVPAIKDSLSETFSSIVCIINVRLSEFLDKLRLCQRLINDKALNVVHLSISN